MKAPILVLSLLMALASPCLALASEPASEGEKPVAEDGDKVPLPTLIAPVVTEKRLSGYVYLGIKLIAASSRDADRLRDLLPLVQDTLLRAFHAAPIQAADADTPAAKDAVVKMTMATLNQNAALQGVQGVEIADYQNVPF